MVTTIRNDHTPPLGIPALRSLTGDIVDDEAPTALDPSGPPSQRDAAPERSGPPPRLDAAPDPSAPSLRLDPSARAPAFDLSAAPRRSEAAPAARPPPRGARVEPKRTEPLSPFVPWAPGTQALDDGELEQVKRKPNLLIEIVADPDAFAERTLDGLALQSAIAVSLISAVTGTALFAAMVRLDDGPIVAVMSGLRLALSVLLAVAAALGPIHAAGVLVAARVPLSRLVGVMLGATAAGALVLAPLGPVVRILDRYDELWVGPLALLVAFSLGALVAGLTLRRLLDALARVTSRAREPGQRLLTESEQFRVGIVSRMALVFLGFTSMLALWGLGAFS